MTVTWDRNREGAWRATFWPDAKAIGWRVYYGYTLKEAKHLLAVERGTARKP